MGAAEGHEVQDPLSWAKEPNHNDLKKELYASSLVYRPPSPRWSPLAEGGLAAEWRRYNENLGSAPFPANTSARGVGDHPADRGMHQLYRTTTPDPPRPPSTRGIGSASLHAGLQGRDGSAPTPPPPRPPRFHTEGAGGRAVDWNDTAEYTQTVHGSASGEAQWPGLPPPRASARSHPFSPTQPPKRGEVGSRLMGSCVQKASKIDPVPHSSGNGASAPELARPRISSSEYEPSEELVHFGRSWGLEHATLQWLASFPPEVQNSVMERFKPELWPQAQDKIIAGDGVEQGPTLAARPQTTAPSRPSRVRAAVDLSDASGPPTPPPLYPPPRTQACDFAELSGRPPTPPKPHPVSTGIQALSSAPRPSQVVDLTDGPARPPTPPLSFPSQTRIQVVDMSEAPIVRPPTPPQPFQSPSRTQASYLQQQHAEQRSMLQDREPEAWFGGPHARTVSGAATPQRGRAWIEDQQQEDVLDNHGPQYPPEAAEEADEDAEAQKDEYSRTLATMIDGIASAIALSRPSNLPLPTIPNPLDTMPMQPDESGAAQLRRSVALLEYQMKCNPAAIEQLDEGTIASLLDLIIVVVDLAAISEEDKHRLSALVRAGQTHEAEADVRQTSTVAAAATTSAPTASTYLFTLATAATSPVPVVSSFAAYDYIAAPGTASKASRAQTPLGPASPQPQPALSKPAKAPRSPIVSNRLPAGRNSPMAASQASLGAPAPAMPTVGTTASAAPLSNGSAPTTVSPSGVAAAPSFAASGPGPCTPTRGAGIAASASYAPAAGAGTTPSPSYVPPANAAATSSYAPARAQNAAANFSSTSMTTPMTATLRRSSGTSSGPITDKAASPTNVQPRTNESGTSAKAEIVHSCRSRSASMSAQKVVTKSYSNTSQPIDVASEQDDVQLWIDAAEDFELSMDFDVSAAIRDRPNIDLPSLMSVMKEESNGKRTIQALADKLMLHRMIKNLGIPQMPVLIAVDGQVSKQDVETLVFKYLGGQRQIEVILKPTHLSNGSGVVTVSTPKPMERQPTVDYLVKHVEKFLAEKADPKESAALRALKPGFIAQPKYKSVVSFKLPLELRVLVLWGRARLSFWWWGRGVPESTRNAWFARRPATPGGRLDLQTDVWEVVHEHQLGVNRGFEKALELFQRHLRETAAAAEALAVAVGAPFLRADFFVGSTEWGVRLNEVAYGCGADYRNVLLGEGNGERRIVDDAPRIARILSEGMQRCRRRAPPERFLSRLGVHGQSYSDLVVQELPMSLRPPLPEGALREGSGSQCEADAVPEDQCSTPKAPTPQRFAVQGAIGAAVVAAGARPPVLLSRGKMAKSCASASGTTARVPMPPVVVSGSATVNGSSVTSVTRAATVKVANNMVIRRVLDPKSSGRNRANTLPTALTISGDSRPRRPTVGSPPPSCVPAAASSRVEGAVRQPIFIA